MVINIGVVSHTTAAIAFVVLTFMLCIGWKGRGAWVYLIAASVATVVWAAVMAYGFWVQNPTGTFFRVFEVLRSSAWLIFLSVVVALVVRRDGRPAIRRWSSIALVAFCIVVLASELQGGFVLRPFASPSRELPEIVDFFLVS